MRVIYRLIRLEIPLYMYFRDPTGVSKLWGRLDCSRRDRRLRFFGPSRAIPLHVAREFLFEAGKGHIDDVNIKTWEDVGFRFAFEEKFKRCFDAFIGCNFACGQLLISGITERNAMFGTAR